VWKEHAAFIGSSSGTRTVMPKGMNPEKKMIVETSNLAYAKCQSAVSENEY